LRLQKEFKASLRPYLRISKITSWFRPK